jgi:hypothetical protein
MEERLQKTASDGKDRIFRFWVRILVFCAVYLAIRVLIEGFVDYYSGNPHFEEQVSYLDRNNMRPAVYFMGTSRVQRQIDPRIFDSILMVGGGYDGFSYNLGVHSSTMLETIHLARNLLRSPLADSCRALLIELEISTNINQGVNKDKERGYYWIGPSSFLIHLQGILSQSDLDAGGKLKHILGLARAFSYRCLGIGRFHTKIMGIREKFILPPEVHYRGFLSLDEEEARSSWSYWRKIRESFDASKIGEYAAMTREGKAIPPSKESPVWAEALNDFIEEAARKGVDVVFLSMPPFRSNLERYVAGVLKQGHYINLADPDGYPSLYIPSMYFDNVHLNGKGAEETTRFLARFQLDRILRSKDPSGSRSPR